MKRERTRYPGVYKVGSKFYVTYRVSGKKIEKMIEGKLSDALREKLNRRAKAKHGTYEVIERQEKTTFKQLLKLYEEEGDGKRYILQFKDVYEAFFDGLKLSQISQKDLFDFRDQIKETPKQRGGEEIKDSTVNRAMAGLRRLFHFAVIRQYLEKSPFPTTPKSGLFYSERRGRRNFFTETQLHQILGASPEWLQTLIKVSFFTGMRMGELVGLRWEHVNLETGVIQLPNSKTLKDSTGTGQWIVMQAELLSIIKTLSGEKKPAEGWVFTKADGMPYHPWNIQQPFKTILEALGIKNFSWKDLRHTTGTLMHLKGADPLSIKNQLRHTTLKTTESFYIGTDVDHQRSQAERLTLNQKAEA